MIFNCVAFCRITLWIDSPYLLLIFSFLLFIFSLSSFYLHLNYLSFYSSLISLSILVPRIFYSPFFILLFPTIPSFFSTFLPSLHLSLPTSLSLYPSLPSYFFPSPSPTPHSFFSPSFSLPLPLPPSLPLPPPIIPFNSLNISMEDVSHCSTL